MEVVLVMVASIRLTAIIGVNAMIVVDLLAAFGTLVSGVVVIRPRKELE